VKLEKLWTGMPEEARDSLVRLFDTLPGPYLVPLSMFLDPLTAGRRMAWVTSLLMLADGDVPKLQPNPDQVGRAVLEILQNGGDNPQLFRRYVRRVIESDELDVTRDQERQAAALVLAQDPAAAEEARAAQTRGAPQSFRAQRGKALIEAAELLAFLSRHQHPQFFNSLAEGAWDELGARRQTAINTLGGLARVMGNRGETKIRDDLADALLALGVDSPRTSTASSPPALSLTSAAS
jgi:hypothetical protein